MVRLYVHTHIYIHAFIRPSNPPVQWRAEVREEVEGGDVVGDQREAAEGREDGLQSRDDQLGGLHRGGNGGCTLQVKRFKR